MSDDRFAIRCPSCGAEGRARAEHQGRKVRCKRCSHAFRAEPAAGDGPTTRAPAAKRPRDSLRYRVEALEREVRAIRRALPALIPRYPSPEPAAEDLRGRSSAASAFEPSVEAEPAD